MRKGTSIALGLLFIIFQVRAAPQSHSSHVHRSLNQTSSLLERQTSCDCQWRYHKHYQAKGCTPVYGHSPCRCPTRFNCPKNLPLDNDATTCKVDGKTYRVGESVNTTNNCEVCHCRLEQVHNRAALSCVPIECPEAFQPRLPEGCYLLYEEGRCCPTGSRCENQTERDEPVCRHGNKIYRVGQKIYPEEDPCLICLCTESWDGIAGLGCRRHDCQIQRDLDKLRSGCVPIYHERTCCPIEYHCASDDIPVGETNNTNIDHEGPEECRLPAVFGTCQEAFPRFYFNARRRRCEEFLYGGCGGNENRFVTRSDCENICGTGRNGLEEKRKAPLGAQDQCVFAQRYYAVGELLDINHPTHCVTCTCSVPPDFTCVHQSCPPPPGDDYEHCTAEYKPGACCAQYTCVNTSGAAPGVSLPSLGTEDCGFVNCDPGCRLDEQVPVGTCPGCVCPQSGQSGDGRIVREAKTCPRVDPKCASKPGCLVALSQEGCAECRCNVGPTSAVSSGLCLPPSCRCPIDPKCPENGCQIDNSNITLGQCPVCRCISGRAIGSANGERLQCPSSSKCPEGCSLTSLVPGNCPVCQCQADSSQPCLPPLCLCSPPRCDPGCRVDRRVPLGRCPGCVCDIASIDEERRIVDAERVSSNHNPNRRRESGRVDCKPLRCESPCKPETRPPAGQCPSCICRFEEDESNIERRNKGSGDSDGGCGRTPPCSGHNCRVVSVDGKCPQCVCSPDQRTSMSSSSGSSMPRCPPADCVGAGCRAVTGHDGCPKCECLQHPECPNAREEEDNCQEPCEWLQTPKRGGCPRCLCPKDQVSPSPRAPTTPRKCPTMSPSSCEGTDCKLVPGSDGCPTCSCQQPNCTNKPACRAPCALQSTSNGRCHCVCPAASESYNG